MDNQRARELLKAERARVEDLLARSDPAVRADRDAANEPGDWADPAVALTAEGVDQAVVDSLRERLAAIERAERRLEEGTYGRSVRSGASAEVAALLEPCGGNGLVSVACARRAKLPTGRAVAPREDTQSAPLSTGSK